MGFLILARPFLIQLKHVPHVDCVVGRFPFNWPVPVGAGVSQTGGRSAWLSTDVRADLLVNMFEGDCYQRGTTIHGGDGVREAFCGAPYSTNGQTC